MLLLGHHRVEHRAQRRVVVDALDRLLDRGVEGRVVEAGRRTAMRAVSESTWWSTRCWTRSMAVSLRAAGSRRPPGGWKWTPLGAGSSSSRKVSGGSARTAVGAGAVRLREGSRERLVRAVAGLDRDVEDGAVRVGWSSRYAARSSSTRRRSAPGARRRWPRPAGRSGTARGTRAPARSSALRLGSSSPACARSRIRAIASLTVMAALCPGPAWPRLIGFGGPGSARLGSTSGCSPAPTSRRDARRDPARGRVADRSELPQHDSAASGRRPSRALGPRRARRHRPRRGSVAGSAAAHVAGQLVPAVPEERGDS